MPSDEAADMNSMSESQSGSGAEGFFWESGQGPEVDTYEISLMPLLEAGMMAGEAAAFELPTFEDADLTATEFQLVDPVPSIAVSAVQSPMI